MSTPSTPNPTTLHPSAIVCAGGKWAPISDHKAQMSDHIAPISDQVVWPRNVQAHRAFTETLSSAQACTILTKTPHMGCAGVLSF